MVAQTGSVTSISSRIRLVATPSFERRVAGDAALSPANSNFISAEPSSMSFGLMSGHRHEKRPSPSTLSANVSVGDQELTHEFLAVDQPFSLKLPIWDLPGIMRRAQPSPDFPVCNVRAYNFMLPALKEILGLPDDAPNPLVHIASGEMNNITFARAIAKIAYCYAVARYGLNGFRHLALPDIILGKYSCVPYFVGSDPGTPPAPDPFGARYQRCWTAAASPT
jgi:hypothetical protein